MKNETSKTTRASKIKVLAETLLSKGSRKPRKDAGKKRGNYKTGTQITPTIKISDKQKQINDEYRDLKTVEVMGVLFKQVIDKGVIRYVPAN